MEIQSTCRICLARNVRMYLIVNTHLQDIYEQLTCSAFEIDDGRPMLACYICRARLQNCYNMKMDCLRTEEYLTDILNKHCPSTLPENLLNRLGRSKIKQIDIPDSPNSLQIDMKMEPTEIPAEVTIKQELLVMECKEAEFETGHAIVKEEMVDVKVDEKDPEKNEGEAVIKKSNLAVPESNPPKAISSIPDTEDRFGQYPAYGTQFLDETMAIDHNDTITGEKPYGCIMCGKCFTQKSYLRRHVHLHANKDRYKCEICKKCFSLKQNLDFHMRIHTGEKPHKCNICEKYFNHQSNLMKHVRKHDGKKIHKCDICKKCFNEKHHLTNHIRIHTGEKPYKCIMCEENFKSKSNLIDHEFTHTGKKPHQCQICDKGFNKRSYLINHIRIHTGEKPFKCVTCDQSFRQKGKYNSHVKKHKLEVNE